MISKNLSSGNNALPLRPEADRNRENTGKKPSGISMRGLISQSIRGNLWLVFLGLLVMLFNYPVNMAMQLSSVRQHFERDGYVVTTGQLSDPTVIGGADGPTSIFIAEKSTEFSGKMTETANQILLGNHTLLVLVIIVAAALCAFAMFRYLYQRSQVDFYHSLPVSRTRRFFAHYLGGALIMAGTWLAGLLGALLVAVVFQVSGLMIIETAAVNASYFLLFLLIYTVTAGALLLVGNLAVGMLATVWIWGMGPSAAMIISGLKEVYFKSVYEPAGIEQKLQYLSPIKYLTEYTYYPRFLADAVLSPAPLYTQRLEWALPHTGKVLLCAAALTALGIVLTLYLYRRRASETAGDAIAFPAVKAPLRILTTVVSALLLSLFGSELSFAWAVFFTITAAIVVHAIMEVIIQLDIRKLLSHRMELLLTVLLSLLIISSFQYDFFGYDRFVPETGQIESAAIYPAGFSDGEDTLGTLLAQNAYGSVADGTFDGGENGYGNYGYRSDNEPMDRMFLKSEKEIEAVRSLALLGASEIRPGEVDRSDTANDGAYVHILYRLKNGRTDERSYFLPEEAVSEAMRTIFASDDYKSAVYPILGVKAENVGLFGIRLSETAYEKRKETGAEELRELPVSVYSTGYENADGALDLSGISADLDEELLEALKKDLSAMQLSDFLTWRDETKDPETDGEKSYAEEEDRAHSYLVYVPIEEVLAEKNRRKQAAQSEDTDGLTDGYEYFDLYPIRDSFTNVKNVLAAHGIEV